MIKSSLGAVTFYNPTDEVASMKKRIIGNDREYRLSSLYGFKAKDFSNPCPFRHIMSRL